LRKAKLNNKWNLSTAWPGGDAPAAIGGAKALKNSVLLPLAFPGPHRGRTPILMRSRLG
jgi:hypothetical protein